MNEMEPSRFDHDRLREEVRIRLAARYERLLNAMEVFLEDDPRDFSAAQLGVYLQAMKGLGDLYQARDKPSQGEDLIPLEKAQRLAELAAVEAAEVARVEERARIAGERVLELEQAGGTLRERLQRLRDREGGQGES